MPISRINITPLLPALERDALILVPNHRTRDAILATYAATLSTLAFRTPRVYAIDIWIRELWDLAAHAGIAPYSDFRLLSPMQELFLWTGVIEESLEETPLLNPEESADIVNQSYRDLRLWLEDNGLQRLQRFSNNPDVAAFCRWIRAYRTVCQQQQCLSLVDATATLAESNLAELNVFDSWSTEILLLNFFQPPPLYRALFRHLGSAVTLSELQVDGAGATADYSVRYTFPDSTAELLACADWAKKLRQIEPGSHIGILCSEDLLADRDRCHLMETALGDERSPLHPDSRGRFNSTGSHSGLLDAALVHDAFLLLNLIQEQQRSQDLCRLLQSPYLLGVQLEGEARLQMELLMRRRFTASASMTEFSWWLSQPDKDSYAPLLAQAILTMRGRTRAQNQQATPASWSAHMAAVLADYGWPGTSLTPREKELHRLFVNALDNLAGASAVLGHISFSSALTHLKTLCRRQSGPGQFDPSLPVSIYSVAEAVGLRFDHAWLLGFSDQSWPAAARPSPFIPYSLQQTAGIPGSHPDLRFAEARLQFATVSAAVSRSLIASFHRSDGEREFKPSSFILALPSGEYAATADSTIGPGTAATALPVINSDDLAAYPMEVEEVVQGGQSVISNQSSCPFRAFGKHRLRVQALDPFETGLSPAARGSAIHEALEQLFTDIDSRAALLQLDQAARERCIASATDRAIGCLTRLYRELMTPRFKSIERHRIARLLEQFLALEASRQEFKVVGREQAMSWNLDNLQLQIKIDRIDELNDHSLALLDYKTGKRTNPARSWSETRPEDMQLPLYHTVTSMQTEQAVSVLGIVHVNVEKIGYSGLAAAANFHESMKPVSELRGVDQDWDGLTANWQSSVTDLAREFIAGEARVAPLNGKRTCQYCGLQPLCRIQELDATLAHVTDDDSDDEVAL